MIVRVCVSLPAACSAVDEEAANRLLELFFKLNDSINLLQQPEILAEWQRTLSVIATGKNAAPVIAGYTTRLLADHKLVQGEELVQRFHYAMSVAAAPDAAAAWLEGFLKGSGTLLLIDPQLWDVVNNWVCSLDSDTFIGVLPLLRRTFSHYTASERRKLGEKVKSGDGGHGVMAPLMVASLDIERAKQGIPVILQLLGITKIDPL
jgi:hypothetical protein